jgi:hypothetical protein|nr:MAG TPA: hypothetical protein [Caudoviricetes sp.]
MAPTVALTGIALFPVEAGNFTSPSSTAEMATHTPLADFLTFWKGIPLDVEKELRDISTDWDSKGRLYHPTIDGPGTTLAHVMPFLTPVCQSQIHTLLAVHYYGLFGATP